MILHFETIVDSQVNRIVQPKGPDPTDPTALKIIDIHHQALADKLKKPVVFLFHSGVRKEYKPKP